MSIKLTTDCNNCIHKDMCKYKNNALHAMDKLKTTIYGDGPNDDYYWDIMMQHEHVNITFSCPDFSSNVLSRNSGFSKY